MGTWTWLLLASAVAFATKFSGYLLPPRWLAGPRMARMAGVLTVGLLAALVAVNTAADGMRVVLDARAGALLVAVLALWLRAPFLLVVVLGAVAAALLRFAGLAA